MDLIIGALVLYPLIHFFIKFIENMPIHHNNNYMLYPFFSWTEINKSHKVGKKYREKADKLYRKVYLSKDKPPFSENFKKSLRQYFEFKTAAVLFGKEFLFMVRSNNEIAEGKKDPAKIYEEQLELEKAFEEDGILFFSSLRGHNTKGYIEKEYQSELKRLQEIKPDPKNDEK